MNIFGFFLFLRFHTYYKSADDIKKIHNLLAPGQVTLLMFSSYSSKTRIQDTDKLTTVLCQLNYQFQGLGIFLWFFTL